MALKESFKQEVAAKEKIKVRVMLKDSMIIDPTLTAFEEMLAYAEERIKPFYDKHNGEELMQESSKWTEKYLDKQMVAVITNFSIERINLLRKMVPEICANQKVSDRNNSSNAGSSHNREKHSDKSYQNKTVIPQRDMGTGLIVIGGVVFVAGVIIPETILTVVGVGAIAVGAGLVYKD